MIIQKADETDITQIYRLAQSVRMGPQNSNPESLRRGFLVYPLDEVGYRERLNPLFTVAHQDDKLKGFLMCYKQDFFHSLVRDDLISHEDGIVGFLMQRKSPFVYGDQIVVEDRSRKSGIGKELMEDLFRRMISFQIHEFFCAVLNNPMFNTASIDFVVNLGLRLIGEVRNQDGFEFGMYHLNLVSVFPERNKTKRVEQVDEFGL